ncbi:ATP-binding protein [Polaromonas sp. JS666]|uniref:ATP-binding protein n=1 Tax=Polaromonas sp. (strain JS666 / ATCC BAA-500) TaxID=296591 RepID=UPI00004647FB|nr:ATP-binding protein [Polaromonas sp. JS666]ABE44554.1 hypothetical protein Bpro_2638 [Polaromonas sp. JS666]
MKKERRPIAKAKKTQAAVPPGEGERRAQRGYGRQYEASAAAIYAGLDSGDLQWVGLADRAAGIADDLVLGLTGRVVGHQFKTSQFADRFRLQTLLMGAEGLLKPLAAAWQFLRKSHPDETVEIRLVTNDYPSTTDVLVKGAGNHSAAFLVEFEAHPRRTLAEWRTTKWQPFIDTLVAASGLDEPGFEAFLQGFRLLHGAAADFVRTHNLSPDGVRLASEIARLLPKLVADGREKDHWTRAELLRDLDWRDTAIARHVHQFPIGAYVQRNVETEEALRGAIRSASSGYISLVGPPGAGKSTLLQTSIEAEGGVFLVRYLAYVPGVGQGVGRGEADDFLEDISTQLKRSGLAGIRFRDISLHERRGQFGTLLRQAGERFQREGVRTLIVVDGLDHVPREERPERSFLAELPLPTAIPEGVLFILGTQRLDLQDLKAAVQDQAGADRRKVLVTPLRPEAVHRMADLVGLDPNVSRQAVFELSHGHPLVTRYLLEALRDADASGRDALLGGSLTFEGDIETVYESAWRGISDDEEAQRVLGYIARAEEPMPLDLLARAIPEHAIERALRSTKHLLSDTAQGWSTFHNSFRLFILRKPRMRFGKPDPSYSGQVYGELAKLASEAPPTTTQRWLELRYLARASRHAEVLALALPARFRQQLAEGRSFTELVADIRLAFAAAREIYDPVVVFRLLLARDEIGRRSGALEQAPAIVDALLAIEDLDGAQAFAEEIGAEGYKVVDALIARGQFARARGLFDKLEPLQQLLSGQLQGHDLHHQSSELTQWAQRVVNFRDADQINLAIDRLAKAAIRPGVEQDDAPNAELARELRYGVVMAVVTSRPDSDAEEVCRLYGAPREFATALTVHAALSAARAGSPAKAMGLLRKALAHEHFADVPNSWRRRIGIVAAVHGDTEIARTIFDGLVVPTVAEMDNQTDDALSEHTARAVLEHAELAAMLGLSVAAVSASKRAVLRPLQLHANAIGSLLGKARVKASAIASGEIARAARAALGYLEQAQPRASDEHYAMYQISVATPVLGKALIQAAALCGQNEFLAVLAEFDRAFATPNATRGRRNSLRREVAVEVFRVNGDSEEASRRLEPLVEQLVEDTPSMQLDSLAVLAACFARVGNVPRARELLSRLPAETLGYALAAKKDPQYVTWMEVLESANAADPTRRAERVAFLLRQIDGMMRTEGSGAAYRIASRLMTEASIFDPGFGLAAARALVESGTTGWAALTNALLQGMVRRRPGRVQACVVTWCALALPYYIEPHYREERLGEFLDAAVGASTKEDAPEVVAALRAAIEAESRAHERVALLERLRTAARKKEGADGTLDEAVLRWQAESPPPRHSYTPSRYDDVTTLAELKVHLERDGASKDLGYEANRAFNRLAPEAGFAQAMEVFERWPSIGRDSRARFVLITLAIDADQTEVAKRLINDYATETDDRATWTEWTGGSTLRYFRARVRMEGSAVKREAYENLAASLAADRESITSVMLELDNIVPTIAEAPDWPAMWNWLAEQLGTTREHTLGRQFESDAQASLSDEDALAELFRWAAGLPLPELRRHVRVGALHLNALSGGGLVFEKLVRLLLAGKNDDPAEAIQLLLLDTTDSLEHMLRDEIVALADHPDYAVAEPATILASRWGRQAQITRGELPAFYRIVLNESDEASEPPQLVDPDSGAMLVESPFGWTFPFEGLVNILAQSGVSEEHVRYRCSMLIDQWGGLEAFGQPATDRLQAELRRLDMKMTFNKPHAVVAGRALRYVAGELRRAGLIDYRAVQALLYHMGFPAPRLLVPSPLPRPPYLLRPSEDTSGWGEVVEKWLQGVTGDVRRWTAGGDTVIAEVCAFYVRNAFREYRLERLRAPFLEVGVRDSLAEWFELLPRARWADGVKAMTRDPAPTIVRRFSDSVMSLVPRYQLVICPYWLRRLGWHSHENNWLVYVDGSGDLMARIVWWRDGGPVDVDDDVIWGEGVYVSLTAEGRRQLEAIAGSLTILVNARRGFKPPPNDGEAQSRGASSRE